LRLGFVVYEFLLKTYTLLIYGKIFFVFSNLNPLVARYPFNSFFVNPSFSP